MRRDPGSAARERVLFLSADLPWPPDGGGRIASMRVLHSFASQFEVDLIALADPSRPSDPGPLAELCRHIEVVPQPFTLGLHRRRQLWTAARSLASGDPYRLRKFWNQRFGERVAELKRESSYVVVHHEQLGVAQYVDGSTATTAMVQNVEADLYRRARGTGTVIGRTWAAVEGRKLARREPGLLQRFDHVFCISEPDRERLREMGVERSSVLPMPAPAVFPTREPPRAPTILTLGSMSWFGVADGLHWFHREVLPVIRRAVPDVQWNLVGMGAPRSVLAWSEDPGIHLLGHVESLEAVIAASRVAVVPLRIGGGIRMKLLDLMAWGIPSVTTTIGAEGLSFAEGAGAMRRDDPMAFAAAVIGLLRDDAEWLRTAAGGRGYVQAHHGVEALDLAVGEGVAKAREHHAHSTARRAVQADIEARA